VLLACVVVDARSVAVHPQRIVSTSPSITETLFAMGLGDRVVGVSRFCRYPEEVQRLPKVGTFLNPDAEIVARLKPDLVIVHKGPSDIERQLAVLRIAFVTVDRGRLSSVYSSIDTIGAAIGEPARAAALTASIEERLGRIRRAVENRPQRKVLLIVGRRSGTLTDLIAVGRNSYLSDIATLAGGTNVLSDSRLPDYPSISMESVIRLAPDVIIDAGEMGDTPEDRQRRSEATLKLWKASGIAAAREGHVHPAISEAFTVPGPRVVEVAETFARWIHGVEIQ
jgi:iron complex transport system substrate-binding protein